MVDTIRLGYEPRDWQRQVHLNRTRFRVLALHRRAGKTELALMELINAALQTKQPLALFAYIAPYLKQAKLLAWARLKARLEGLRRVSACDVNEGDLAITFTHNGATIKVLGADNPDALRGARLDGVVIDEVAQVRPEVWQDIVQPMLSDRRGWALFIGTPSGVNLFSELFYKAQATPEWHSARYTVYDTQAIDKDEVERLRRDTPEASFAREYLCDFSAAGSDQLVSLLDAETAARREYLPQDLDRAPKVLGVDPARFGDDRSVIAQRWGLQAYPFRVYQGIDNMDLASRVANVIEDWEPDAVFIDSGAGAGVIDRLRMLRYDVIEVPFGGKAVQPNLYANRRAEMWWEMAQWIRNGGAIPNDVDLKQELATPIYWYDTSGRRVLEAKEDIKKRLQGGKSPDMADALALTFAAPIRRRDPLDEAGRQKRIKDYDPYALK
jgi:hypothetical protein